MNDDSMRIGAFENPSFVEFIPMPEISSHSFELIAAVDGRQVQFNSLTLLETERFLSELYELRNTWKGSASLTGTYDFSLRIQAWKPEVVWITIHAVDYISTVPVGDLPCARHLLEAAFQLEGAAVFRMFEEFKELFSADKLTG